MDAVSVSSSLYHFLSIVLFASLFFSIKSYNYSDLVKTDRSLFFLIVFLFIISSVYFLSTEDNQNRYFLALVLAGIGASSLLSPVIALGHVISFLILRPWELIPDDTTLLSLPRILIFLFFISLLLQTIKKQSFSFKVGKIQILFLAYLIWVFLSASASGYADEAQTIYFDTFFKSIFLAWLTYQVISDEKDYNYILRVISLAVFGVAIFALVKTFYLAPSARLEGAGAIQNSNDLAAILIFVFPLSLAHLLRKKINLSETVFLFIAASTISLALWKAQSRAAYLALLAMLLVYWLSQKSFSKKYLLKVLAIGLISSVILFQLSLGRDASDLQESKTNRIGYWKAGAKMAVRHPVLGIGFDQYPKNFNLYGVEGLTEGTERTAHSSWVLVVAENGFPALFLLIAIFYYAFKSAWSCRLEKPELIVALCGYTICFSFLSHTYWLYPYLLLALIFSSDIKNQSYLNFNWKRKKL